MTLIACINATGWSLPPFLILKAKHHNRAWYHQKNKDWRITVSKNSWTTNKIGLAWLEHFIRHTEARTVGGYQLLILDSHKSHQLLLFQNRCEESKVITLCMPAHASHLRQPLDVGCFAALKRAYKKVHDNVFSSSNIITGFRTAGLVPDNPEAVLLKLDVKPRTPSPPLPGTSFWQPKTPSNAHEITPLRRRLLR